LDEKPFDESDRKHTRLDKILTPCSHPVTFALNFISRNHVATVPTRYKNQTIHINKINLKKL
jgi:hypothetical protein